MTDETNELDERDQELLDWLKDITRQLTELGAAILTGRDRMSSDTSIDDLVARFQRDADRIHGWTNWETERSWSWWTSDRGNAEHAYTIVKDGTLEEAASRLRQWAVDFMPKVSDSFYLEILQRGLERVDYLQLADAIRTSLSRAFGGEPAGE